MAEDDPSAPSAAEASPGSTGGVDLTSGVGNLGSQQQSISQAVSNRQLHIDPEIAGKAARICREHARRLRALQQEIDALGEKVSFGTCEIGQQLARKFVDKARGGPDSLNELVSQAEQIVDNMARTYEAAGRAYDHTDQASADALRGLRT